MRASTVETAGDAPVSTPLLQMQVEDLVYWMSKFVLEARKADGSEYLPDPVRPCLLLQAVLRGQRILFKKCALTT